MVVGDDVAGAVDEKARALGLHPLRRSLAAKIILAAVLRRLAEAEVEEILQLFGNLLRLDFAFDRMLTTEGATRSTRSANDSAPSAAPFSETGGGATRRGACACAPGTSSTAVAPSATLAATPASNPFLKLLRPNWLIAVLQLQLCAARHPYKHIRAKR